MELLQKYGYSLVFLVVFLEQLGLPIPAAPILILAGAFAAGKMMSFHLAMFLAILACLIGDTIWFQIGKIRGRRVLKTLCALSLSPDSCVKKTETSFLKRGMNSLIIAKFVPGLNTIAPPMAGLFHGRFFAFFWRDVIGSALYVLALLIPGFLFEKQVHQVVELFEAFGKSISWILLGGLVAYILIKYLRLKTLQRVLYKERITPEELHQRLQDGEPITLVDLRSHFDGEEASLPGAIKIHPGEIDQNLNLLDKERWIVMYCT